MSASSTLSVIAPQFNSIANRDEYLSLAELNVNRCLFDSKGDMAVALMAAHMLALNTDPIRQQSGGAGQITSKKEGDLSISFSSASDGSGGDLFLTVYGLQFQRLSNSVNTNVYVLGSEETC